MGGKRTRTLVAGALCGAVVALAAGRAEAGDKPMAPAELLASNCFSCHGFKGQPDGIMEEIAGMSAKKFTDTVLDFKYGRKPSTVMQRIAKGYGDDEIAVMGTFFADMQAE